jgi:protein ImuB
VVVSANFDAARMKAAALQGARGVTVIAAGEEPSALSKLPLSVLELDEDFAQTFAIWGIYTLGELAALPESDLVARLGPRAREWRNLARGVAQHTLQPVEAELTLKEFCAFETAVEQIDSLLLMGARMIDCLATRAAGHALALASLSVEMQLEGGKIARRSIRPALATVDRKFLLKLLQLEIAAHPPEAAVMSLTVSAEPGQSKKVQLGLFAPQTPEPSRLDVTLARLMTIAGEDRVGSPVLEDSHRAGSFRMERFAVGDDARKSLSNKNGAKKSEAGLAHPHMALRRVRPAAAVRVEMDARGPAYFSDREHGYRVTAAYGPWKSSGCWWSTESWNTEEWDVLAESSNGNGLACLLVHDCVRNRWQLEAYYD